MTEREKAAFVLGIEYAADHIRGAREWRRDARASDKRLLLDMAAEAQERLGVARATASEVDIDLRRARAGIE